MRFPCCDPRRLDVLRSTGSAAVNAIEFIEVLDRLASPPMPRQRTLLLRLLRAGATLSADQVVIDGGERIQRVPVLWVGLGDALPPQAEASLAPLLAGLSDDPARLLVVRTGSDGDFSRYTLRLRAAPGNDAAPAGFDPRLAAIDFSFKVECPSDFDCDHAPACPPDHPARPDIDYLVRDYPGFRRLMLDRLALLAPDWTERNPADVGVAVVEVLAYAADQLAYRQDAVANEAYIGTARRRESVRRHARLVDYRLHDGCNARAWVQVQVSGGGFTLARGTQVRTRGPEGSAAGQVPDSLAWRQLSEAPGEVFETVRTQVLDERCNRMAFYTWGDRGCCLPMGTTEATLRGRPPLAVGDVLVFEEIASPTAPDETTAAADADPARRWAVRLTAVDAALEDPSGGLFDSPPTAEAVALTGIRWAPADALPFPLCLGSLQHPGREISVARGNLVLADHGQSLAGEVLPDVPAAVRHFVVDRTQASGCAPLAREAMPVRYSPSLSHGPLTQGFDLEQLLQALPTAGEASGAAPGAQPFWPASSLSTLDARHALPRAVLHRDGRPEPWLPEHDLLGSGATATRFVVETDLAGRAHLRFGDDRHGQRPNAGDRFTARYRIGNGSAGNVGAQALAHVLIDPAVYAAAGLGAALPDASRVLVVRNPLPAAGGTEPEDLEAARRDAPEAFRTQERAVTADDHAEVAQRSGEVQRAAATFRWTGSWRTAFVTADRHGGAAVDAAFVQRLRRHMERYRMAGLDLAVDAPRAAPLELVLHLCISAGHFRAPVLQAVRQRLSDQRLADGSTGLFHPDRFSFGDPVYLSPIVAAVQATPGVRSVQVQRFGRLGDASPQPLADGVLRLGRLEIAQLANNPNFPERGRLTLLAEGAAP